MDQKLFSTFKTAKLEQNVFIEGSCHSLIYIKKADKLLVCNCLSLNLEIYKTPSVTNRQLKLLETISMEKYFNIPGVIRFSEKNNEIFIVCENRQGVFVLNGDDFKLERKFADTLNHDDVDFAAIDDNDSCLFIGSNKSECMSKWNCASGTQINEWHTTNPRFVCVKQELMFVISNGAEFTGIIVINKNTLKTVKKISHVDWKVVYALTFDKHENLVVASTVKQNINENDQLETHLFVFNSAKDYEFENRMHLQNVGLVLDMLIVDNQMFAISREIDWEFYLNEITLSEQ